MTENRIFNILLKYSKNEDYDYDNPKLQEECAEIAADKFTEIIYETLKQKSTASHMKRGNILKYLQTTCAVKQCHLNEDSYECFLKVLRKLLHSEKAEVNQLVNDITLELEQEVPTNLVDKMVNFYKRKNLKQNDRIKKLEFITEMNQKKLDLKFNLQTKKNFSYYETNEKQIKDYICNSDEYSLEIIWSADLKHTVEYRKKQIRCAYALLNLRSPDLCLIEAILQQLALYKTLEPFEVNFLVYLFLFEDETLDFAPIVAEKFPLLLERLILKYVTDILRLKEDIELDQYFTNLESDKKLAKIRKTCGNNLVKNSVKCIIYESYHSSYRNKNVLKLIDFVQ